MINTAQPVHAGECGSLRKTFYNIIQCSPQNQLRGLLLSKEISNFDLSRLDIQDEKH
jgi:hypothetical protein